MATIQSSQLTLETRQPIEFLNITDQVAAEVRKLGVQDGFVLINSEHTTAAVVVNEECPELKKDMMTFLEELVPPGRGYHHDRVASDGRPNAHSHLLGLMLSHQVMIPLVGGKLCLGTWQKIFFVELDGPRSERRVSVLVLT